MRRTTAGAFTAALALAAAAVPSLGHADVVRGSESSLDFRGGGSMIPLAQHIAEAYMLAHPEATIVISGGSAQRGLKSLVVGTADVAMASRTLPEALAQYAHKNNVAVEATPIYYDAVAAIVHPKNPVSNLTVSQLRDVFRGKITNWKEVGGDEGMIVLSTHYATSGSFETLKTQVLGDDAVVSQRAQVLSNVEMLKLVSVNEKAIGYTNAHDVKDLKALTVNGVASTAENVRNETYPIRRQMCLWFRAPLTPMAARIRQEFLSPDAKDFVRKLGDVPVP